MNFATRVFFLSLFSCNFDDQLSPNILTDLLFYACWDTPSENSGLWQLPKVSSGFNYLCLGWVLRSSKISDIFPFHIDQSVWSILPHSSLSQGPSDNSFDQEEGTKKKRRTLRDMSRSISPSEEIINTWHFKLFVHCIYFALNVKRRTFMGELFWQRTDLYTFWLCVSHHHFHDLWWALLCQAQSFQTKMGSC